MSDRPITIISAKEAAELLQIHVSTLYAAAREGEIPCLRIRSRYVFTRESILACLPGGSASQQ